MTDEQRNCAHETNPVMDACRKCGLSARAFLMGDRPETAWVGMLDSVRFGRAALLTDGADSATGKGQDTQ